MKINLHVHVYEQIEIQKLFFFVFLSLNDYYKILF